MTNQVDIAAMLRRSPFQTVGDARHFIAWYESHGTASSFREGDAQRYEWAKRLTAADARNREVAQ